MHDRAKNHWCNHHLDKAYEDVTQGLQLNANLRIEMTNDNTEPYGDQDLDVEDFVPGRPAIW
jgi:hypothetical protein